MVEIFFQTLNYSITFGLKLIILHSNIDVFSFEFYFSYWWLQSAGIQEEQKSI